METKDLVNKIDHASPLIMDQSQIISNDELQLLKHTSFKNKKKFSRKQLQGQSPNRQSILNIDTTQSKDDSEHGQSVNNDQNSASIILKSEINIDSTLMNTEGDETKVYISLTKSPLHEDLTKVSPIFELDQEHVGDQINTDSSPNEEKKKLQLNIPDP